MNINKATQWAVSRKAGCPWASGSFAVDSPFWNIYLPVALPGGLSGMSEGWGEVSGLHSQGSSRGAWLGEQPSSVLLTERDAQSPRILDLTSDVGSTTSVLSHRGSPYFCGLSHSGCTIQS